MNGPSVGISTTTGDTFNATQRMHNRSTGPNNDTQKFDFSRLVKSIMANPFQNTGMNDQTTTLAKAVPTGRKQMMRSINNRCKPCRETIARLGKTASFSAARR